MTYHWPSSRLIINIKDLLSVHRVEKQRVEFKRSWNLGGTSWQVLHSICAFGNGGYIIIGVENEPSKDGQVQVCGVPEKDLEKLQKEINGQCKGNIRPEYRPVLSPEIYDGKHVLVIWATTSENGPHQCRTSAKGEFEYYIRNGPETKVASREERTQLLEQHTKIPFDDRRARDIEKGRQLSEDDIDADLVKGFLKDIGSNILEEDLKNPRQLYENMRLVKPKGDREEEGKLVKVLVPRNVALLFFHPAPHEYFQGAETEITFYHDNEVMDDRKETGPIDLQITKTLEYILANTKSEKSPAYVQYPRKAVREAIVNAFYHRGYEPEHNNPVKVRIYSTHIDIISYPGPHQSLKPSHFSADSDIPPVKTRNRRVGEFLAQRMLAEEKGTGVRTIFRSMKHNRNLTPEFQFDDTYFRVRLPRHPKFMVREVLTTTNQLVAKGEKQKAVNQLLKFLEKNSEIRDEPLFEKLINLHDNDKNHPTVQQYKQFITDRMEQRAAIALELHKWCDNPLDITVGVDLVQCLINEGATSDHEALQEVVDIAVSLRKESNNDRELRLQANQKAHQLFQAMGEVAKTDSYVAFHNGCCKFNLYLLNTTGKKIRERKELASYLREAEVCINDALQLTDQEHSNHIARQYRQLGYIHSLLWKINMTTLSTVTDYYDKARESNPEIHINEMFIPEEFRTKYRKKTQKNQSASLSTR